MCVCVPVRVCGLVRNMYAYECESDNSMSCTLCATPKSMLYVCLFKQPANFYDTAMNSKGYAILNDEIYGFTNTLQCHKKRDQKNAQIFDKVSSGYYNHFEIYV